MKIVFVTPVSRESPSGRRFFPLAAELARRGHAVAVIALHHDLAACPARRFVAEGVEIVYAGQMAVRKVGNRKEDFPLPRLIAVLARAALGLTVGALRRRPDVVHLGKAQPVNGLAGVVASAVWPAARLYVDCDDDERYANRLTTSWQRWIVGTWQDALPRLADGVTVNTRYQAERVRGLGVPNDRIVYVPNGVERRQYEALTAADAAAARRWLGVDARPLIVYVGSLSLTTHPVDLLIDAFAEVARQDRAPVLAIVGGGEDFDRIVSQVRGRGLADRVVMTGRLSPDRVPAILAAADLTVDPVRDDIAARARSPLKIVESLAAGTPVVTGDVGDRRALLGDGAAGVLVRPGDASALAAGLLAALNDQPGQQRRREAALTLRERFYWDVLADTFVRVYRSEMTAATAGRTG